MITRGLALPSGEQLSMPPLKPLRKIAYWLTSSPRVNSGAGGFSRYGSSRNFPAEPNYFQSVPSFPRAAS